MANTMVMKKLLTITALVALTASVVKADDDDHGVYTVSLDTDSFDTSIENRRHFVMFYAPWCGHCKNLAPTWDQLAKIYNSIEDGSVIIAKVDCTVEDKLCADHEIVGFPTLKLFDLGGGTHKRYTGKRDLDSLKAFVQEYTQEDGVPPFDEDDVPKVPEAKSPLVILDDSNFDDIVATGKFFIKFYAPWCGHCKKLAPTWDDLAETFSHTDEVGIAKIDCTVSQGTCSRFGIRGYPTLLWFEDGDKADQYQGGRSHEALKAYVTEKMHPAEQQEEREEEEQADKAEVKFQKGIVADLTEANFKSFIADKLVFVKFFAPWCGHCKRLAPTWEELAKNMATENVAIAKVDCTQHKSICDENEVRGYPTLKMFLKGEMKKDYRGSRSVEDLHSFVKDFLGHDEL